jgi:hypothetical protein
MGQSYSTASWTEVSDIFTNFLRSLGANLFPEHHTQTDGITVLQGSSTYFLKELGLLGELVGTDELRKQNAQFRIRVKDAGKSNLTNLANSIATEVFTQGAGANTTHVFGARSLEDAKGHELYTSLWASKAAEIIEGRAGTKSKDDKFVIMDVGTGEIKRFLIQPNMNGGFEALDLGKLDGYKFSAYLEEKMSGESPIAHESDDDICSNLLQVLTDGIAGSESRDITDDVFLPSETIYVFGTASMRKIQSDYPERFGQLVRVLGNPHSTTAPKMIAITVLTPEEEAAGERDAFVRAFNQAANVPADARECPITGFLSWGNGSLQGKTLGGKEYETKLPIGLKSIKAKILEILGKDPEAINDRKYEINYGGDQFEMLCSSTRMWLVSQIALNEESGNASVNLPHQLASIGTVGEH